MWEWTGDCYHYTYDGAPIDGSAWVEGGECDSRIVRGGSWNDNADSLRSAYRLRGLSRDRNNTIGFRVARTLDTR
jgi:formylglycine-generating enzyme required for sulfatase activity